MFIAGSTYSYDYPTTPGAYDTSFSGYLDSFVSKFDINLSAYIPPCMYWIYPDGQSFPANGGSGSVNVGTYKEDCTWTATSNKSWNIINAGTSGIGNGTVNYSVSANTTISQRIGTMTIAGQTFTVTQEGAQTNECSTWDDVIGKYNGYVSGQASLNDVITCYNQYAS